MAKALSEGDFAKKWGFWRIRGEKEVNLESHKLPNNLKTKEGERRKLKKKSK